MFHDFFFLRLTYTRHRQPASDEVGRQRVVSGCGGGGVGGDRQANFFFRAL